MPRQLLTWSEITPRRRRRHLFTVPVELLEDRTLLSAVVSDDFSSANLNTDLWTFVDPVGNSSMTTTGTHAEIQVPAGSSHDLWTNRLLAPRLLQNVDDVDFEVEAKFESAVTERYQIQGIIAQQDAQNLIRFDMYHDGSNTKLFAATFTNGSASTVKSTTITGSTPVFLRMARTGSTWTLRYSSDGVTWATHATFQHSMTVTQIGPFAGNHNPSPAHTASVDYFFSTDSPIVPEDGVVPPSDTAPIAVADTFSTSMDSSVILDVLTNDTDAENNLDPSTLTIDTSTANGTLVVDSLTGEVTYTPANGFTGTDGFSYTVFDTTGLQSNAATVTIDVGVSNGPVIAVWYDAVQDFGALGRPQEWVNVLGNVSDPDGIASLTYTLNGGNPQALSIGHDFRRLVGVGDFNIEIDADDLLNGSNTVVVTAVDGSGDESVSTVTVNYTRGNTWPLPYSVDWNDVSNINDASQVVDGRWSLVPGGVRSVEPGYDRLINIGDMSWQNYEVTAEIVVNDVPNLSLPDSGGAPGIGILMRWQGHNENSPHQPGDQPRVGFSPLGSIAWYRYNSTPKLELTDSLGYPVVQDNSGFRLQQGVTYNFRSRVQTTNSGHQYTFSVWQKGQPESTAVVLGMTRPLSEPANGSLLLVSHKLDATFGNVVVTAGSVATPTISPGGGTYSDPVEVTMQTSTPGAQIHYTIDGSEPTESDPVYLSPFTVSSTTTVRARAFLNGLSPSSTATASFTIQPGGTPSDVVSDDFSSSSLNTSLWTFEDPVGDASVSMTGNTADILVPGGTSHDLWTGRLLAPRLLQTVTDGDFEVEAKYESTVTTRYQLQGIVAQQDSQNLIRFDVYHDGNSAYLFSAKIVNGSATAIANTPITSNVPLYLRLQRNGNTWVTKYSVDGLTWSTHSTFQHTLQVSQVGPFAGNHGSSAGAVPQHTASIDYFFNTASPIVPEDGDGSFNLPPIASHDAFATDEETVVALTAPGVLTNDDDPDGDPLTVLSVDTSTLQGLLTWAPDGSLQYNPQSAFDYLTTGETVTETLTYAVSDGRGGTDTAVITFNVNGVNDAPQALDDAAGTLSETPVTIAVLANDTDAEGALDPSSVAITSGPTNGSVVIDSVTGVMTYQSAPGFTGEDIIRYTVTDIAGLTSNEATLRIQVGSTIAGPVSDEFSSTTLNTDVWKFIDPRGDSTMNLTGTAATISVPAGASHDLWTNRLWAPRLVQDVADEDFEVEAHFESTVDSRFQIQGLIAQQDDQNLIRFDTYHDGKSMKVFAARVTNGSASSLASTTVPAGAAQYLRLTRNGSSWTARYSADGLTWSTLLTFEHTLQLAQLGVFVGNHGTPQSNSPAHTGIVNYFRNTAAEGGGAFSSLSISGANALDTTATEPLTQPLVAESDVEESDRTVTAATSTNTTSPLLYAGRSTQLQVAGSPRITGQGSLPDSAITHIAEPQLSGTGEPADDVFLRLSDLLDELLSHRRQGR